MNSQITYLFGQLATLGPIGTKLPAPGTAGSVVAIIAGYFLLPMGWIPFLMLTILISVIGVLQLIYTLTPPTPMILER